MSRMVTYTVRSNSAPNSVLPEPFQASWGQTAIYLKYIFAQNPQPFNMTNVMMYDEVNHQALQVAFHQLVHRYEVFRCSFELINDKVIQKVLPASESTFSLLFTDLTNHSDPFGHIQQEITDVSNSILAVSGKCLLYAHLYMIRESRYAVAIVIDHIVSDGWSVEVMMEELATLYDNAVSEKDPDLPHPVQYRVYAEGQRKYLASHDAEVDLKFWMNTVHPYLSLPSLKDSKLWTKLSGSAQHSSYRQEIDDGVGRFFRRGTNPQLLYGLVATSIPNTGASYAVFMPEEVKKQLSDLCALLQTSSFSVACAAIAILMNKRTGISQFLVGTPVADRPDQCFSRTIGWFLNTLLVDCVVHEHDSAETVIRQVFDSTMRGVDHSRYPFEMILDVLDVKLSNLSNLFVHVIDYSHMNKERIADFTPVHKSSGTPTFDLNFTFRIYENGIKLICDYRTELWSTAEIEDLTGCFLDLFSNIVNNPAMSLAELP